MAAANGKYAKRESGNGRTDIIATTPAITKMRVATIISMNTPETELIENGMNTVNIT